MGVLKLRLTQVSCLAGAASSRGRQLDPRNSSCRRSPTTPQRRRSSPGGMSRSWRALAMPRRRHQRESWRPMPHTSSMATASSQGSGSATAARSNTPCWRYWGSCLAMRLASLANTLVGAMPMATGSPRSRRTRWRSACPQAVRSGPSGPWPDGPWPSGLVASSSPARGMPRRSLAAAWAGGRRSRPKASSIE